MIHLRLVPFGEEERAWPMLRPYFERIPRKIGTTITPDRILAKAKERRLMLWKIYWGWCLIGAAATGETTDKVAFIENGARPVWERWRRLSNR